MSGEEDDNDLARVAGNDRSRAARALKESSSSAILARKVETRLTESGWVSSWWLLERRRVTMSARVGGNLSILFLVGWLGMESGFVLLSWCGLVCSSYID